MSNTVTQISITLENAPGTLSTLSDILGKEGINVGAVSLAESTEQSIVRLITDNPGKAVQVLTSAGYQVTSREVIAVETPDHPGGLNAVLKPLSVANVNVHYLYPFLRRVSDNPILIFRVSDTEKAIQVLKDSYIRIIGDSIYNL
ncbi:MAG TPA: amino acid-binding protein [bacterium]|nr:amino acid-binding protein [bacterium]